MADPSRGLYLSSYQGISLRGRRFRTWRPRGLRPAGRRPPFDLARVAEVAPRPWCEVRAQLVDSRHAGRYVQVPLLVIPERVEMLYQRPKAVSVRGHDNAFASHNIRNYRLVPVRTHPPSNRFHS